jgi:hypothetical protein
MHDLRIAAGDIQNTLQKAPFEMLQVNTLLHTIELNPAECDMRFFTKAILPRLEKTPQFRSVSQTPWRVALYSVNGNPAHTGR